MDALVTAFIIVQQVHERSSTAATLHAAALATVDGLESTVLHPYKDQGVARSLVKKLIPWAIAMKWKGRDERLPLPPGAGLTVHIRG